MRDTINLYKISFGKPEGMRALETPRIRWEDNIKMGLNRKGLGCGLGSSASG
jgi:hypothetical protein